MSVRIGTPLSTSANQKGVACGAGELGKEVIIELQRLGVETISHGESRAADDEP
jgi:phosphoribosylglycinamide formyltransferase 2